MISLSKAGPMPAAETKAAPRQWLRPELRRLRAGAAENAAGAVADDPINFS